jgi:tellurite resistance protein TehA-like permease
MLLRFLAYGTVFCLCALPSLFFIVFALCPAAFRSGAVMGFILAGFGLLNLFIAIVLFQKVRISLRGNAAVVAAMAYVCTPSRLTQQLRYSSRTP